MSSSNAYKFIFTLYKYAIFGLILLTKWVDGIEKGEKCAYVIKVWLLKVFLFKISKYSQVSIIRPGLIIYKLSEVPLVRYL